MTKMIPIVVLSAGLDSFKEIRQALSSDERVRLLAGGNDTDQLYDEVIRLKPAAAIVTLDTNTEQGMDFIKRLAVERPAMAIISAARTDSADLVLRSLRAGARDFLRIPIVPEELKMVLDRASEFAADQEEVPKKKGRMISVFSSKGGCGTSFLATNLAASMSAKTVLVDLNLQAGDLPLFLGVDPKYSIADMAENRERLDESLVNSFITPYSSSLSLLAAPKEVDAADDVEAEHIFLVLQRLRESYELVVLDPQHTFDAITLAALDQSDEIVLVLTLDIPAIRSTQRALEIFDRLGYPRKKIKVVVNRWSKQIDLDLQQVEKFLGESVTGFIPSDYQTAVTSINLGQPLVHSDSSSKIAGEIRRLAKILGGGSITVAAPKPQRSFWGSLLRRNEEQAPMGFQTSLEKV
ncbi:MAG TPA: AAA family ATPase [Pyrinomonadaceae bacterium]|nr:AAA family ATPase [Pyrinomonadaceae bacterium]